jgi:hypothetical protein
MPFEDVDIRSPELVSIEYHVAESTLLGFSVFQFYTVQIFIHMTRKLFKILSSIF